MLAMEADRGYLMLGPRSYRGNGPQRNEGLRSIVSLQICAAILKFCRIQTPIQQYTCPSNSDLCV